MNIIKTLCMGMISCTTVTLSAQQIPYTYSIPSSPWKEGMGNHRAVIEIKKPADAVRLNMEWRRPDNQPEKKRFFIIHAQTGDTIPNVKKLHVNNEECNILFGPVTTAGTYYFYYLPYKVQLGQGTYYGDYIPDQTADSTWYAKANNKKHPVATVKKVEAKTEFDSFYPMEIIATRKETTTYCRKHPADWYTFPEDRKYPIRMTRYLPVKWMKNPQGKAFKGTAAPNEYYTFQIGIWSPDNTLEKISYKATDFSCGTEIIPAGRITCFNVEGINPQGNAFRKEVTVPKGKVQALWFGMDIPSDIKKGTYTGYITLSASNYETKKIPVSITINGPALADRGDNEPWRHSRLRWLNSTLGEKDTPVLPYTDIAMNGNCISCLGRKVSIHPSTPLPQQINSWGTDVLASSIRFVVETEQGIRNYQAVPQITEQSAGHISWIWKAGDKDLTLQCTGKIEFDGWMNYTYTLLPQKDIRVKDIRLELPVSNHVGSCFLGAGLPGQDTPATYEGKWDTPEKSINHFGVSIPVSKKSDWLWPFDSFWIGNAHAGIHCELRGSSYSGPLLSSYRPAYPASWHNEGKGGFKVKKDEQATWVTVYSGERRLKTDKPITFDFALIITPVKPLNIKSQFTDRYYHNGAKPVPTDEDVKAGVKIINIHHANEYNPYINYPFLSGDKLKKFIDEWHGKGCKVKLYYTLRELTSAVTELWAIRSLGNEILKDGNGGGYPWCREHLVTGYTPQWYQHFENADMLIGADAALLTSESDSRWYNYYIEGLKWMVQHYDIDGIYLDDVSFGRDILKRMRRAMEEVKPGCIIDLHSNTGFSKGPANQYAEFFPYIDKLWFGESFLYDKMTPTNWLVESSGIPFGLMGDMLYRGGNKWLGMQYGMTVRHPWLTEGVVCDPRIVWKIWDEFGIADAEMIGFWEKDVAVKTDDEKVKVTVYRKKEKVLLSVGNYSDENKKVRLHIDWKKLGLRSDQVRITVPDIPTFQEGRPYEIGDELSIEPRKGYLIYIR